MVNYKFIYGDMNFEYNTILVCIVCHLKISVYMTLIIPDKYVRDESLILLVTVIIFSLI